MPRFRHFTTITLLAVILILSYVVWEEKQTMERKIELLPNFIAQQEVLNIAHYNSTKKLNKTDKLDKENNFHQTDKLRNVSQVANVKSIKQRINSAIKTNEDWIPSEIVHLMPQLHGIKRNYTVSSPSKLLYIKIPKTAGSWLISLFRRSQEFNNFTILRLDGQDRISVTQTVSTYTFIKNFCYSRSNVKRSSNS